MLWIVRIKWLTNPRLADTHSMQTGGVSLQSSQNQIHVATLLKMCKYKQAYRACIFKPVVKCTNAIHAVTEMKIPRKNLTWKLFPESSVISHASNTTRQPNQHVTSAAADRAVRAADEISIASCSVIADAQHHDKPACSRLLAAYHSATDWVLILVDRL